MVNSCNRIDEIYENIFNIFNIMVDYIKGVITFSFFLFWSLKFIFFQLSVYTF